MPTITAAEIAIVAAAILLVYAAPSMLTLLEGSRQKPAPDGASSPLAEPEAPSAQLRVSGTTPVEAGTDSDRSSLPDELNPGAAAEPAEVVLPEPEAAAPAAPSFDPVRFAGYEPPAVTPFHGSDGYRFRVEDLHRARLADWPPDSVQSDPARHRLWTEAVRLAAEHDAAIAATDLVAPRPVRSACLGAGERRMTGMTLHYLLFPDLWPVAPEDAVARAVFEIDSGTGALRHSVDILQP